ncbi:MAG: type II secretion system protein GspN [Deltaproteobacteria bacterium]|nr:type II secretion system protein GspN [Deltaproteobacteria bacterium]
MAEIKKNKKWLGYTIYGIVLTVVLLYFLFPSAALRDIALNAFNETYPNLHLSISKISPSFPFNLNIQTPELALKESPDKVFFKADNVSLHPKLWSLLTGKYELNIHCTAYNGELMGWVNFEEDLFEPPFDSSIEFNGMQLEETSELKDILGVPVTGILNGKITYHAKGRFPGNSSGDADIRIFDCRIGLAKSILGLTSLEFNDVSAEATLNRQILNIKMIDLKGRELNGTISGRATMRREILESRLDLRGSIVPFAETPQDSGGAQDLFKLFGQQSRQGKLSFTIRGTFKEPQFRLM